MPLGIKGKATDGMEGRTYGEGELGWVDEG